jgi:hypothetical protein
MLAGRCLPYQLSWKFIARFEIRAQIITGCRYDVTLRVNT